MGSGPLTTEPLPGVLGNKGTWIFICREQGIFSNYFQGTNLEYIVGNKGTPIFFQLYCF